ncbi:hypothetical protein H9660_09265 [Clostridium sp. Sa3CUN1]|uniref:Flagellar protein FliT n=1 Tax=Clostridium gallinarum TaxID=2762246 RepID=A0ABR8Q4I1_9CLOT|nr:hypothetical protein [Clostridium gallinarum]MBD7915336.1 hypothetical protein [Clostridium gallinarum]
MIKDYLLQYKELTEAIIVNIKNDLDAEKLMNERGKVLRELLENKTLNKEDVKNIYIDLKLDKLDKLLKEEINKAREKTKEELRKIAQRKNANRAYGKSINTINNFNKKI